MHALVSEPLENSLRVAQDIHALATRANDPAMMIGAYRSICDTTYFMGSFQLAKTHADHGMQIWEREGPTAVISGEISIPVVTCMCFSALASWQLGNAREAFEIIGKATKTADDLAHAHSQAVALHFDGYLSHFCGLPARAVSTARRLIDLSRHNDFRFWLAGAHVQLGWALTLSGAPSEGLPLVSDGIRMWRATNAELIVPYWLALSTEAQAAVGRRHECVVLLDEAIRSANSRGELWWKADLQRLKARLLVDQGDVVAGKALLAHALDLAREQGALTLQLRAATEIAQILVRTGERSAAKALVTPLLELIDSSLDTVDLRSARAVLSVCA
jgi:adenylate cyclase